MVKKLQFLILALCFTIIVSSCGTEKAKPDNKPATIHLLVQEPDITDPVSDALLKNYQDAADSFHALHPQLTVVIDKINESKGTGDYIIQQLKSDSSPDLVAFPTKYLKQADRDNILLDIKPLMQSSEVKEDDFYPGVLDSLKFNGKLLLMPYAANPVSLLYNKEVLEAKGIPLPQEEWTWQQLSEASKKIDPMLGSALWYSPLFFQIILRSLGKDAVSSDGDTTIGYLDGPEAVSTLTWMNNFYHDFKDKKVEMNNQFDNFMSGKSGFIMGYYSELFYFDKDNMKAKLGIAPLPYFQGGKHINPVNYKGFSIAKKSKFPEAAWLFIQYLTASKNQYSLKLAENVLAVNKTVSEAAQQSKDPLNSGYIKELKYAVQPSGYNNPILDEYYDKYASFHLYNEFQDLIAVEEKDIPAKLNEYAVSVDKEIARLKMLNAPTSSPSQ